MVVSRWNPWNEMLSVRGQAQQAYNEALGQTAMSDHLAHPLPLDIRQTEDAFRIEASVPGFRPEDVEINFDESVLTIRGIWPPDDDSALGDYVQRERHLGSVHRHVHLPAQVRVDEISAHFENGILTVVVPRAQKARPKRIRVSTTSAEEPTLFEASTIEASATA